MTSQTGCDRRGWRCTATAGMLALGLLLGGATATALADPAEPSNETQAAAPPTTAEEVLAIIARDYDTGAGGGQLSNLIHEVLKLRAQGFMPSNGNKKAIVAALDHRPNQGPLIKALQQTLNYQRGLQARAAAAQTSQNPATASIGQMAPGQMPPSQMPSPAGPDNTGVVIGPTGGIGQPVG